MSPRFYFGARAVSRPFVRLVWAPRVSGAQNIPAEGGFVIASNHLANIDSFLLPLVLPRQIRFVAKESLWTQKGLTGWILKWFFTAVEAVPVDREAFTSGKGALQAGAQILRDVGVRKMILLSDHAPRLVNLLGYGLEIVGSEPLSDDEPVMGG